MCVFVCIYLERFARVTFIFNLSYSRIINECPIACILVHELPKNRKKEKRKPINDRNIDKPIVIKILTNQ